MASEVTSDSGQPDLLVLSTLPIRTPPLPSTYLLWKTVSAGRQRGLVRQVFVWGTLVGDKDSGSFQR